MSQRDTDSAAEQDPVVERGLEALAEPTSAPLTDELERALGALAPARTRSPRRDLVVLASLSLLFAGGLVGGFGLRHDLASVPLARLLALAAVWLSSFLAITYLVVVPPRGHVMPRVRLAARLALVAAAVLITCGLLFAPEASAIGALASLRRGHACFEIGLLTAALPIGVAVLVVRGSLPVGARPAALALGAGAGSLGGLALQFHCPLDDRWHLGLVHGGVVVLAAGLAWLVASIRSAA